jgi:hypothetical protein
MTTLIKIRGLDRIGNYSDLSNQITNLPGFGRGFRLKSALGLQYPVGGVQAYETVGTVGGINGAVTYTAQHAGALGNNISVIQNAPSGSTRVIALTFASGTGYPVITITPSSTDTAATLAAAVNLDYNASQYVVASLPGTGASAPVASANANAVITLSQATGTTTAGTFTLTFPGYGVTAAIAYGASASTVATAVQAVTGGTVTGGGGALPTSTTLTFSGGLAATPIATPIVNNTNLTGGTYQALTTTLGTSASGILAGGLNIGVGATGNAVGLSFPVYLVVNQATIVVADLDDAFVARQLYRIKGRWVSLGQP